VNDMTTLSRRSLLCGALAFAGGGVYADAAPGGANDGVTALKVLRYAFPVAETGFDPARIVDLYSRIVTAHIFEALYAYDHLARPPKIKPLIADGPPEISADFRTWTVKIRQGIFFADDPAFGGKKREVAEGAQALRLRHADRRHARARPLHDPVQARRGAAAAA
jgi:ABC-type transport system substrate-binding protein